MKGSVMWRGLTTSGVVDELDYYACKVVGYVDSKKKNQWLNIIAEGKDMGSCSVERCDLLISKTEYDKNNLVMVLVDADSDKALNPERDIDDEGRLYVRTDYCCLSWANVNLDYLQCENCGQYFRAHGAAAGITTEDGFSFCNECVAGGAAWQCPDCGRNYSWETSRCGNCYYSTDEDDDDDCMEIHPYHYAGDGTDYGMPHVGEEERYKKPLLGVEVEIDLGGESHKNAKMFREILGYDHCVICRDASLRKGMEIISCPANYEAHKNLKWKEFMEKALELGYKAHDPGTCGLHVHIDREFFEMSELPYEDIEGAFFVVLRNNLNWLKPFSRRRTWEYCQINGDYNCDDDQENKIGRINSKEKYDKEWNKGAKAMGYNRYQAINISRCDTIEIRMFRGTLKYSTFIATLQLVDMTARLIQRCEDIEDAMQIVLDDYLTMAEAKGYKEFLNYLKELGILEEPTGY